MLDMLAARLFFTTRPSLLSRAPGHQLDEALGESSRKGGRT